MKVMCAFLVLLSSEVYAEDASICTDRPAKANAACSVPAGKFQLETSAVSWSLTRSSGSRSKTLNLGASTFKMGLSDRSDFQLSIVSFVEMRLKQGGSESRRSGFGDVIARYKHRLTKPDASVQLAFTPFLKLPTASRGIGNNKFEAGMAIPVSISAAAATITLGPELDILADSDGHGHHAAFVNVFNVSAPVAHRLTLAGELWTNVNLDPEGTVKQSSLDAALAYALSNKLQLDGGANLGLTPDTSDIEFYTGVSLRF